MRDTELIAGVDEAGRGPLAGPVVVAAVILDPRIRINGLADSKVLSPARREQLFDLIVRGAIAHAVVVIGVDEIDRINILQATLLGMRRAIEKLQPAAERALIDGKQIPHGLNCAATAIIDGDAIEPSIGAASILAKVSRDRLMCELDFEFPAYGFAAHKGYGTPEHLDALARLGPCRAHRQSFAPVRRSMMPALLPDLPAADQPKRRTRRRN